jgi:hypothetical protein
VLRCVLFNTLIYSKFYIDFLCVYIFWIFWEIIGIIPVSKCYSGHGAMGDRLGCSLAYPSWGAPLEQNVGTARAALRGAHPGELHSSGTTRAAQQLFSGVGKNAHYRGEVWGAIAHRGVRLPEVWAPQRDVGWAYIFKDLNMKNTLK